MKFIVSSIILLALLTCEASSLDTTSTKYYPLKVGNSWTYFHVHVGFPSYSSRNKVTITGTTTIGGHLYYIANYNSKIRIDSVYGRFVSFDSNGCQWLNNERLIDSLQAHLHDSCRSDCQAIFTKCIDTSISQIFGMMKSSKTFRYFDNFETVRMREYAKDIGLTITFTQYGSPSYDTDTLKGCVIDGVLYGDTTLTGFKTISTDIPNGFSLSQNHPNPFNPVTKIKFSIPLLRGVSAEGGRSVSVNLTIYDIQGREMAVLVNETLSPGTYEAEWDGTNYPSGVYFYKLITADYTETRKMVLIK